METSAPADLAGAEQERKIDMTKRGGWILAETLSWMAAASVILCGVGVFVALGNDPEHWERELRRHLRGAPRIVEVQAAAPASGPACEDAPSAGLLGLLPRP
jgi:hypothetical protein